MVISRGAHHSAEAGGWTDRAKVRSWTSLVGSCVHTDLLRSSVAVNRHVCRPRCV